MVRFGKGAGKGGTGVPGHLATGHGLGNAVFSHTPQQCAQNFWCVPWSHPVARFSFEPGPGEWGLWLGPASLGRHTPRGPNDLQGKMISKEQTSRAGTRTEELVLGSQPVGLLPESRDITTHKSSKITVMK